MQMRFISGLAFFLAACGSSTEEPPPGSSCPVDEPAAGDLTVVVRNDAAVDRYIRDGRGDWERCEVPFLLEFPSRPAATLSSARDIPNICRPNRPLDCIAGEATTVPAGGSIELSWDGLLNVQNPDLPGCDCWTDVAPSSGDEGTLTLVYYEECPVEFGRESCTAQQQSLPVAIPYEPDATVEIVIAD